MAKSVLKRTLSASTYRVCRSNTENWPVNRIPLSLADCLLFHFAVPATILVVFPWHSDFESMSTNRFVAFGFSFLKGIAVGKPLCVWKPEHLSDFSLLFGMQCLFSTWDKFALYLSSLAPYWVTTCHNSTHIFFNSTTSKLPAHPFPSRALLFLQRGVNVTRFRGETGGRCLDGIGRECLRAWRMGLADPV